jgi:protease PrsW
MLGILVSVLPVLLFLGALVVIDSYKLVALRSVLFAVAAGLLAGAASYGVNVWLRPTLGVEFLTYSRYVAPGIE